MYTWTCKASIATNVLDNRSRQEEPKMQKQHAAPHKKQISMNATGSMALSGHGIPIMTKGGFS
jgi:hypothetical protein